MRPAQTPAFPVPAESAWADGETIDAIAVDTGTWNLVTDGEAHDVTATVTLNTTVSTTPWQGTLQLVRGTDEVVAEKNVGVAVGGETGSVVFQVTEAGTYKVVDKSTPATESEPFTVKNVASMADLFAAGKATQGTDSATGRVVNAGEDGVFTISGVDGTKQHMVAPTYALPEGASAPVAVEVYDADDSGADNTGYFADNDGVPGEEYTETTLANACKTGAYWVAVQPKAGDTAAQAYAGGVLYVKVVLQQSTLEGVYAIDGTNVDDTTFTYDAQAQTVNFAVNGAQISPDTTKVYKADGTAVDDAATDIIDAGSYYAIVTLDDQTATVPFEVGTLDLSAVSVTVNDVEWTKGSAVDADTVKAGATVNGEKLAANNDLAGKLSLNAGLVDRLGEYTAAIAPADDEDKNITGTATASFKAVEQVVAAEKFFYDDVIFEDAFKADPVRVFNNSVEPFSVDKIAVQDANGNDYAKSRYTVSLTDEEGNEVSSATEAGTYVVTVSMVPGSDWALGGKATGKFTVTKGTVAAAKVSVTFDGKAVGDNFKAPYDGTNLADKFAVSVTLGGEQLAEGTDYEVVFKDLDKTGTAQVVDSVVNVNSNGYQLEVKGVGYAGTAVFKFSVEPVTAKALKVDEGAFGGVAWTGEAVAPTILYSTKAAADSTAADWKVLDPEMYSSVYKTSEKVYVDGEWDGTSYNDGNVIPASEVVDAGTYAVTVALYADVVNLELDSSVYSGGEALLRFDVVKTAHFIDVPADAWYADGVYTAWKNTYMEGIAEGIFAPENAMTRAEFAQLVFNMAGGQKDESGKEFPTQFADVPANAWYAQAVEWAARYGIVNGTSETTFAPNETISREQIAAMFYRYAGNGAEADLSVLDQFEDADQVSGWAKEAMAWAVENGYVNGTSETTLAPSETATRAQIAVIAVRLQPEAIA